MKNLKKLNKEDFVEIGKIIDSDINWVYNDHFDDEEFHAVNGYDSKNNLMLMLKIYYNKTESPFILIDADDLSESKAPQYKLNLVSNYIENKYQANQKEEKIQSGEKGHDNEIQSISRPINCVIRNGSSKLLLKLYMDNEILNLELEKYILYKYRYKYKSTKWFYGFLNKLKIGETTEVEFDNEKMELLSDVQRIVKSYNPKREKNKERSLTISSIIFLLSSGLMLEYIFKVEITILMVIIMAVSSVILSNLILKLILSKIK